MASSSRPDGSDSMIGKAFSFLRGSLWLDFFFQDTVIDSGSASVAGVVSTAAWVIAVLVYAITLVLQTTEPAIATENEQNVDPGTCEQIQDLQLSRSPLGYYVRAFGPATIAANDWLPASSSSDRNSSVVKSTDDIMFLEYLTASEESSGAVALGPGDDALGASSHFGTVSLCRGSDEYLEISPIQRPLGAAGYSPNYVSSDLTRALYEDDHQTRFLLADLSQTPPQEIARIELEAAFTAAEIRDESKTVVDIRDGLPSVWNLETAESFLRGPSTVRPDAFVIPSGLELSGTGQSVLQGTAGTGKERLYVTVECMSLQNLDAGDDYYSSGGAYASRAFAVSAASGQIVWQYSPVADAPFAQDGAAALDRCPIVNLQASRGVLKMYSHVMDGVGPRWVTLDVATGSKRSDLIPSRMIPGLDTLESDSVWEGSPGVWYALQDGAYKLLPGSDEQNSDDFQDSYVAEVRPFGSSELVLIEQSLQSLRMVRANLNTGRVLYDVRPTEQGLFVQQGEAWLAPENVLTQAGMDVQSVVVREIESGAAVLVEYDGRYEHEGETAHELRLVRIDAQSGAFTCDWQSNRHRQQPGTTNALTEANHGWPIKEGRSNDTQHTSNFVYDLDAAREGRPVTIAMQAEIKVTNEYTSIPVNRIMVVMLDSMQVIVDYSPHVDDAPHNPRYVGFEGDLWTSSQFFDIDDTIRSGGRIRLATTAALGASAGGLAVGDMVPMSNYGWISGPAIHGAVSNLAAIGIKYNLHINRDGVPMNVWTKSDLFDNCGSQNDGGSGEFCLSPVTRFRRDVVFDPKLGRVVMVAQGRSYGERDCGPTTGCAEQATSIVVAPDRRGRGGLVVHATVVQQEYVSGPKALGEEWSYPEATLVSVETLTAFSSEAGADWQYVQASESSFMDAVSGRMQAADSGCSGMQLLVNTKLDNDYTIPTLVGTPNVTVNNETGDIVVMLAVHGNASAALCGTSGIDCGTETDGCVVGDATRVLLGQVLVSVYSPQSDELQYYWVLADVPNLPADAKARIEAGPAGTQTTEMIVTPAGTAVIATAYYVPDDSMASHVVGEVMDARAIGSVLSRLVDGSSSIEGASAVVLRRSDSAFDAGFSLTSPRRFLAAAVPGLSMDDAGERRVQDSMPAEDADAILAAMVDGAPSSQAWLHIQEDGLSVRPVLPSRGDTSTSPSVAVSAMVPDEYQDAGMRWAFVSSGDDNTLRIDPVRSQLVVGPSPAPAIAMAPLAGFAALDHTIMDDSDVIDYSADISTVITDQSRVLYYGGTIRKGLYEFVRDVGSISSLQVQLAFENQAERGIGDVPALPPQFLVSLPLRTGWIRVPVGEASPGGRLGMKVDEGALPASRVREGGRVEAVFAASLQAQLVTDADAGTSTAFLARARDTEIEARPCLDEAPWCMRLNLAGTIHVTEYRRRFSLLAAPGAIGGFSAVVIGALGAVVGILKTFQLAGRRVESKNTALIVGKLVQDDDDETLDSAATELKALAEEREERKKRKKQKEIGKGGNGSNRKLSFAQLNDMFGKDSGKEPHCANGKLDGAAGRRGSTGPILDREWNQASEREVKRSNPLHRTGSGGALLGGGAAPTAAGDSEGSAGQDAATRTAGDAVGASAHPTAGSSDKGAAAMAETV